MGALATQTDGTGLLADNSSGDVATQPQPSDGGNKGSLFSSGSVPTKPAPRKMTLVDMLGIAEDGQSNPKPEPLSPKAQAVYDFFSPRHDSGQSSGSSQSSSQPSQPPQTQPGQTSGMQSWAQSLGGGSVAAPAPSSSLEGLQKIAGGALSAHVPVTQQIESQAPKPKTDADVYGLTFDNSKPQQIKDTRTLKDFPTVNKNQTPEAINEGAQEANQSALGESLTGAGLPMQGLLYKFAGLSPITGAAARAGVEATNATLLNVPSAVFPETYGQVQQSLSTGNPSLDEGADIVGGTAGSLIGMRALGGVAETAMPGASAATKTGTIIAAQNLPQNISNVVQGKQTIGQGVAGEAESYMEGAAFGNIGEYVGAAPDESGIEKRATNALLQGTVGMASPIARGAVTSQPVTGSDIAQGGLFGAGFGASDAGHAQDGEQQVPKSKSAMARTLTSGDLGDAVVQALGGHESHGDYGATNTASGHTALGKYQVMDYNLANWSKKYLGKVYSPDEFLNDPEAQDRLISGLTRDNLQRNLRRTNGDVQKAIELTAINHYGDNNAHKYGRPELLDEQPTHNGKKTGPSPNDFAADIVGRVQGILKGGGGNESDYIPQAHNVAGSESTVSNAQDDNEPNIPQQRTASEPDEYWWKPSVGAPQNVAEPSAPAWFDEQLSEKQPEHEPAPQVEAPTPVEPVRGPDREAESTYDQPNVIKANSLPIEIKAPVGSTKSAGTDASGVPYTETRDYAVGEVNSFGQAAGDPIRTIVDGESNTGKKVFVVDRFNDKGEFQDHTLITKVGDLDSAESYAKSELGDNVRVTETRQGAFRDFVNRGDFDRPFSDQANDFAMANSSAGEPVRDLNKEVSQKQEAAPRRTEESAADNANSTNNSGETDAVTGGIEREGDIAQHRGVDAGVSRNGQDRTNVTQGRSARPADSAGGGGNEGGISPEAHTGVEEESAGGSEAHDLFGSAASEEPVSGSESESTNGSATDGRSSQVAESSEAPRGEEPNIPPPLSTEFHTTPARVPLEDLDVDAHRFQYKLGGNEEGVTDSLKDVTKWSDALAGSIMVWRDPADGRLKVINGHHRYALAKALGVKRVNIHILPEGLTDAEARTYGALANIAEGRGTAIDAAKLLRDSGLTADDLQSAGVKISDKIAADGLALANLHSSYFDQVATGKLPLDRAAIVGAKITDPDLQKQAFQAYEKFPKRLQTNAMMREVVDEIAGAPKIVIAQQEGLFGAESKSQSLGTKAMELKKDFRERLTHDRNLFGKVAKDKTANELEAGGNKIDVDKSQQIAKDAAQSLEVFDALKNSSELAPLFSLAAKALAEKGAPKREILDDLNKKVAARVKDYADTLRKNQPAQVDPDQNALFGEVFPGAHILARDAGRIYDTEVGPRIKAAVQAIAEANQSVRSTLLPSVAGDEAKTMKGIMREHMAALAHKNDVLHTQMKEISDAMDKLPQQVKYDFIDKMEHGQAQDTPELESVADQLRAIRDERVKLVQALGTGKLRSVIENYFPHIWENPEQAEQKMLSFYTGRNMEGNKGWTKQRVLEYFSDGIAKGLKPISDNPVELMLVRAHQMDKYIMAHNVMNEAKSMGLVKFRRSNEPLQPGEVKLGYMTKSGWRDDPIGIVYGNPKQSIGPALDNLLDSRDDILDQIPPGAAQSLMGAANATETDVHGTVIHGYWVMPEDAGRLINNYLAPGLRYKSGAFRGYLALANTMNQAQLGWSAFHLGFTTIDSVTSQFALGVYQLAHGDIGEGLKSIGSSPASPITTIFKGNKLLKEWKRPGSQGEVYGNILQNLIHGGGRAQMDSFYQTKMWDKMKAAWRDSEGPIEKVVRAGLRAPFAVTEKAAAPILEWIVPRMKLGSFMKMAEYETNRLGPDASTGDVRGALGKAWDSVDNRMGQLVYDNLFWSRTTKDVAMASVRSVGWNLGTFRELGGGLVDTGRFAKNALTPGEKAEFTHRMSYVIAMPVVTAMMGALTQKILTGENPSSVKDLFFPRDGGKDDEGNPTRVSLPSYMKDVYSYYSDVNRSIKVGGNPLRTVLNKMHPALAMVSEMLENRDYYGTQIRNTDDPLMQQLGSLAAFAGESFIPFSAKGIIRNLSQQGSFSAKSLLPEIGLTPAPTDLNQSDAEALLSKYLREGAPAGGNTEAESEKNQSRRQILKDLRSGNRQKASEDAKAAYTGNVLSRSQIQKLPKEARVSAFADGFQKLPLDKAEKVYELATPERRTEVRQIMAKKYHNAAKNGTLPKDQMQSLRERYATFRKMPHISARAPAGINVPGQ